MEPWERTDPRSAPVTLLSPYGSNPRTRQSFTSPGQKCAGPDGATEGRGGRPGRNGPSNPGDRGTSNPGDRGTSNPGDRGTSNPGDRGTRNHGDRGTRNDGDRGTRNDGDRGTRNDGDRGTRNPGDRGTRNDGDRGTRNPGDRGTRNDGDRGTRNDGDRRTSDRRTGDASPRPYTDSSRWDPQNKKTRHPNESQFKDRRTDGSTRALRGQRSATGPARSHGGPPHTGPPHGGPPHASRLTFEVKMDDFPELAVATPGTSAPPASSWGPKPHSQGPQTQGPQTQGPQTQGPQTRGPQTQGPQQGPQTRGPHSQGPQTRGPHSQGPHTQGPVSSNKTQSDNERPAGSPCPRRRAPDVRPVSVPHSPDRGALHAVKPGPVKVSPGGPERPASASWANVASQPPRKPVQREEPVSGAQEEQEDSSSERKRRKRKKKPPRSSEEEPEEPAPPQEPPKFEDEEEFPDLGRPSAGASRPTASSTTAPSGSQKTEKATGKKSKVPLQLDIGNMLEVLERKHQSQKTKHDAKPLFMSVGGACPVGLKKGPLLQKKAPWQQDKFAHNPLDSTSPMVKKGKQREVPKAKKPTQLKRVILKEREERKQNRLLQERGLDPPQEQSGDTGLPPERPGEEPEGHLAQSDAEEEEQQEEEEEQNEQEQEEEEEEKQEEEEEEEEEEVVEEEEEEEVVVEEEEKEEEEPEEQPEEQPAVEPPPHPTPHHQPKIHSRKFRDYCSQVLSKEVDECVSSLLRELVRFQDRLYQKDPMKARMKKRLVMGLREVLKHLRLGKVKCVVISPNCERSQSKGGLDEALHTILETCRQRAVPFVFALSRKALGRCVNKAVPVSLVGIFNYDGAQDFYHKMIELSSEARKAYEEMLERVEVMEQTEEEEEVEEENPGQQRLRPAAPPPPPARVEEVVEEKEEPEYIKLWKKMLENDCNHPFLNFEEQLGSLRLDGAEPRGRDEQS